MTYRFFSCSSWTGCAHRVFAAVSAFSTAAFFSLSAEKHFDLNKQLIQYLLISSTFSNFIGIVAEFVDEHDVDVSSTSWSLSFCDFVFLFLALLRL